MNPTATPGSNVQSTLDSINSQIGSINQSAGSNLPTVNLPTTISSKQLTPQPSITVTQPNPSSAPDGLSGAIQSNTDQYQANLDKQAVDAAVAGAPGGTSLQQLMDALNSKQGASALTDQAYTQSVDPAQAALSKINQQIVSERNANQQQLDALRANPGGAFGTGLQQQLDQVNQLSLSRQANLAVIQMAAQGQYDSAKTIADRAVAAATEAQQNHINALQLSYTANKDAFTQAEQRSFEAAQKTRQDALDEKTYELRSKYDETIKQSDPLYQAQLAKAQADARTAAAAAGVGTTQVGGHTVPQNLVPYFKTSYSNIPYVDLSSATPTDKGKLAQIASQSGFGVLLNSGDASKVGAIADAKTNLASIGDAAAKLLGSSGSGQVGAALKNTFLSSFLPDVKSFNAWRTAIINNVQALAGGTGSGLRINKAEIDAAMENDLPVITGPNADSAESAQKKLDILNTQLDNWEKQILGGGNHAQVTTPSGNSVTIH